MLSLSVDDGCASDVHIADLAEKYEINCVFYWPVEWHSLAYDKGYEPLDYEMAMRIASEHEIGSHTITHRYLTQIPQIEAFKEILGSQFMLKRMFGQRIAKFAAPRGYMTPDLSQFASNFYESQRLTKGAGLVHVHPNSGANGNLDWKEYLRLVKERNENDGNIELWMHSYDLDRFNLWSEFEEVLSEAAHS